MPNDRVDDLILNLSSLADNETDKRLYQYHTPSFVYYGTLAALVQNLTGVGSDGGAPADCTHL